MAASVTASLPTPSAQGWGILIGGGSLVIGLAAYQYRQELQASAQGSPDDSVVARWWHSLWAPVAGELDRELALVQWAAGVGVVYGLAESGALRAAYNLLKR